MSVSESLILTAAAAVAGLMNAIAGGGTLLTFPSLLAVGTPAIVANATSTLALMLGTAGSVYGYRHQIPLVSTWLKRFVPVSIVGGLIGSVLLTHTPERVFGKMVPFLLLFATIVFVLQGAFRKLAGITPNSPAHSEISHKPRVIWGAMVFQFLVSVYGGYFGAGIGILMLASLGFLGLHDIHEMNAVKTVLSSLINLVASIYFVITGLVDWSKGGIMTAGALAGYFLGSHYSQRIPQKHVRRIITGIGLTISAVMFYKQFR